MELRDIRKDLLDFIEESKTRPALVTAKLMWLAEDDQDYFDSIHTLALHWIDLLAEMDYSQVSFDDVYMLVVNVDVAQRFNERLRISRYLHQFRTQTFDDDSNITFEAILCDLYPMTSTKALVCKIFCCLHLDNIDGAHGYLTEACDKDILLTRSMLLCFGESLLKSLKNSLAKARENDTIQCSCNRSAFQNLGFTSTIIRAVKTYASSEHLAETSFISSSPSTNSSILQASVFLGDITANKQNKNNANITNISNNNHLLNLCKLHRTISDIDDLLRTLESRNLTSILNVHVKADRFEHALIYLVTRGNDVNIDDIRGDNSDFEKLKSYGNPFRVELKS